MTAAPTRGSAMRATSRRGAVMAGGVAVVTVGGCTTGSSAPSGAGSGSTSPSGPTPNGPAAGTDPDREALDRAVAVSGELLALVTSVGPAVDPGGRLAKLHVAHLQALAEATGATASPASTPSADPSPDTSTGPHHQDTKRSRVQVRRRELTGQRELAALAVAAQSGALARLLASMSAGIAAALSARREVPG